MKAHVQLTQGTFQLDVALEGRLVAVVGANGAGKSTLLRALAGGPHELTVDGRALGGLPAHQRRLGWLPQAPSLFPHLTVAQNVGFAGPAGPWLEALDLTELADRRPHTLSGGQQQRVALARTLAAPADLLLLDEPTAALDLHARAHVRALLAARFEEVPAVVVTHDPRDLAVWDPWIVLLHQGRILAQGPRQTVSQEDPLLRELLA